MSGRLRVLLADDQRLVRTGFAMILSVADDIEVVGEAADGRQAVEQARALRPDLVLMDVQMPVLDGIEATRIVVEEDLAKVVILTTFDRDDYLFAGLEAGASGFLLKNAEPDLLVEAVRAVGHGHALLAPEVTRRVIARMYAGSPAERVAGPAEAGPAGSHGSLGEPQPRPGGRGTGGGGGRHTLEAARRRGLQLLTDREREVLELMGRGRSNAEIAEELVLGEATVKTHVSNCLAKLHLRDRIQAVVFAYEAGLILPGE